MSSPELPTQSEPQGTSIDVLIVGAGFAGLYMLHKARQIGLNALVIEAGGGVGGTWYSALFSTKCCRFVTRSA